MILIIPVERPSETEVELFHLMQIADDAAKCGEFGAIHWSAEVKQPLNFGKQGSALFGELHRGISIGSGQSADICCQFIR